MADAAFILTSTISDDLFKNVKDTNNPKEIWDILKSVCTQVGQGVMYASLKKLFNYAPINKAKGLD